MQTDKITIKKKKTEKITQISEEWERRLIRNDKGKVTKSIENFQIILENHEKFKGRIELNEMTEMIEIDKQRLDDVSIAEIERIIEKDYGIYDEKKVLNALRLVANKHKYNSIKIMLESLKWDGIKRADTILCKYLGAEEDEFTAICFKMMLFGAIERIYNPGAKFDYMLILKGGQGLGKSTFFNVLCGKKYYQENLADLKKSFEYTQGKWIVEMGELDALKKSEKESFKNYITVTSETYRMPYDRTSKDYPRKFILIGTTNEGRFLDDMTGSRRFLVLECAKHKSKLKHSVLEEGAEYEIKQALAETFEEYKEGKSFLELPKKYESFNENKNKNYVMDDGLEGLVENFLDTVDRCCVMQIFDECLESSRKWKYSKTLANRISSVVLNMPNWERYSGSKDGRTRFVSMHLGENGYPISKEYGKQVVFEKIKEPEKDIFKENANTLMNGIYGTENEDYFMEVNK